MAPEVAIYLMFLLAALSLSSGSILSTEPRYVTWRGIDFFSRIWHRLPRANQVQFLCQLRGRYHLIMKNPWSTPVFVSTRADSTC